MYLKSLFPGVQYQHRCVAFTIISSFFLLIPHVAGSSLQVLLPLYIYPTDPSWTIIANLATQYKGKVVFNVIANPSNGPGSSANSDYAAGIAKMKATGNVNVLGYVATGYGNCFNWSLSANGHNASKCPPTDYGPSNPLPQVYKDLATWNSSYGVNISGFFLDEFLPYQRAADLNGTAALNSALKDYADLYTYIKAKYPGRTVFGNPGYLDPRFQNFTSKVADVMDTEEPESYILSSSANATQSSLSYFPPGYGKAMIVHDATGTNTTLNQLLDRAVSWGVTYFSAVQSYSSYPSFFSTEVYFMSLRAKLQVLYPLYIDPPSTAWNSIASLAKQYLGRVVVNVVANVNNGPDTAVNPDYTTGIRLLKANGANVWGYVATGYGNCFNWSLSANGHNASKCPRTDYGPSNPLPQVYKDLTDWTTFYGSANITGFLLDEFLPYGAAADANGTAAVKSVLQDYQNLYKWIKQKFPNSFVIGNPGYLDPRFTSAGVQVADAMSIEEDQAYILSSGAVSNKASLSYFPATYGKAMIVNAVTGANATAIAANIQLLINRAVSWGVTKFVAVRTLDAYPSDFFPTEVSKMSLT